MPDVNPYITFSSPESFSLGTYNVVTSSTGHKFWDQLIEYSIDAINWNEWDGSQIESSQYIDTNCLYIRGINRYIGSNDNRWRFRFNGSNISISGSISVLLNYDTTPQGVQPYALSAIFDRNLGITDCRDLILNAPSVENCYSYMFYQCTNLLYPPIIEPKNSILEYQACYQMFKGCTSLRYAPELSALTIGESCYQGMFEDCYALAAAPSILPATSINYRSYALMFANCKSLVYPPEIVCMNAEESCRYMFGGCDLLVVAPTISTVVYKSCLGMFLDCYSLTSLPEFKDPAPVADAYYEMFYGCNSLKLSEHKISCYSKSFKLPTFQTRMLFWTGGEYAGSVEPNKTYYLWYKPVIYINLSKIPNWKQLSFGEHTLQIRAHAKEPIPSSELSDLITYTQYPGDSIITYDDTYIKTTDGDILISRESLPQEV